MIVPFERVTLIYLAHQAGIVYSRRLNTHAAQVVYVALHQNAPHDVIELLTLKLHAVVVRRELIFTILHADIFVHRSKVSVSEAHNTAHDASISHNAPDAVGTHTLVCHVA